MEELTRELEEEKKNTCNAHEQLMWVQAEYENFQKRVKREQGELIKMANEHLILKLLSIVDDLERIVSNVNDEDTKRGVEMVYKNLTKTLEGEGLRRIGAEGARFDPFEHEAVEITEEGDAKAGEVTEELRNGYKLNNRVIRTSLVRIKKEV